MSSASIPSTAVGTDLDPICGSTDTGDGSPCQRSVVLGEWCFMHGEDGPPADHGAPEDNQNAVGNSGGGAPELNTNAATHSGYSDPLKHFDRLWGDARDHADELVEGYRNDYALVHDCDGETVEANAQLTNRFRALAAMVHQRGWMQYGLIGNLTVNQDHEIKVNGETRTVTTEKTNPAIWAYLRLSSRIRKERRDMQIHGRAVARAQRERGKNERQERNRDRVEELLALDEHCNNARVREWDDLPPSSEDTVDSGPEAPKSSVEDSALTEPGNPTAGTGTSAYTALADGSGEPSEDTTPDDNPENETDDDGESKEQDADYVSTISGMVGGRYPSY